MIKFNFNFNLDDFFVTNSKCFCIFGSHMNVSFCDNNTFVDNNFAARTYELASVRAFNVSAFAYGRTDSESSCICERNLNL